MSRYAVGQTLAEALGRAAIAMDSAETIRGEISEEMVALDLIRPKRRVQIAARLQRVAVVGPAETFKCVAQPIAGRDTRPRGHLLVDSTGAGEPIFDNLRTAGCSVRPYPFTAQSKQDLINNLALILEKKLITLPTPETGCAHTFKLFLRS